MEVFSETIFSFVDHDFVLFELSGSGRIDD